MAPANKPVLQLHLKSPAPVALVLLLAIAALFQLQMAAGADPDALQDIAVADLAAGPLPNGYLAKPVSEATIDDFITSALVKPGDAASRKLKAVVTPAFVPQFPGLNTQGVGVARIDFESGGLNAPHIHPRASEIFILVEGGPLLVGLITSTTNPNTNDPPNQQFNGTLYAGQAIVFPRGLVHFQKNIGPGKAFAIAAFNSQNPGVEQIGKVLFGASPYPIASDILEQALGLDADAVAQAIAFAQRP